MKAQKNTAVSDMLGKMNKHFDQIKESNGIDNEFQDIDKKGIQHRLEDVIRKLRPNCKARNFKEYLKSENNQNVYQSVRAMAR